MLRHGTWPAKPCCLSSTWRAKRHAYARPSAQTLGRTFPVRGSPRVSTMANAPDSLPPEVLAAFARRQPIEAIKLLLRIRASGQLSPTSPTRLAINQPPGGTKAAVTTPPPVDLPVNRRDGLSPGEVPRTESTFWGWVVAALLLYLAYRLLGG